MSNAIASFRLLRPRSLALPLGMPVSVPFSPLSSHARPYGELLVGLPDRFYSQLDLSRGGGRRRDPAGVFADRAVRIEDLILRQAEIGAVQQVETLEAELQLAPAGHSDVLADNQVHGLQIGPDDGVAREGADVA